MKKLINEVVTLSLIISFLSNTLATVTHAAEVPKNHPARTGDKTVAPSRPNYVYDMVPKADGTTAAIPAPKRHAPYTMSEKIFDFLGIRGATPAIDPNRPTFSSIVMDAEKAKLLAEREAKYSDMLMSVQNQLNLGVRRKDGSVDFKLNFEQPATRLSPTIVSTRQMSELIVNNGIQKNGRTSAPFYFPAQQSEYELKMSAEEMAASKERYKDLRFETAGKEGDIYRVRVRNPKSKENLFVGFKVDKELAKKFSPLMVEETLTNKFKEASVHAAQRFPMEALTFYTGIYFNTLLNLSIQYENDPAALDKIMHEFTSIEGNISFFAFMLGNGLFSSLLRLPPVSPNASIGKKLLRQSIGFLGMGVGSIASAFSHDVMTMTKSCALNMMKLSEFDDEGKAKALSECDSTYNSIVNSANMHNYIVSFMNILGSAGLAGIGTQAVIMAAGTTYRGATAATTLAGQMTFNQTLIKSGAVMEGLVVEMNTIKAERQYYTLSKHLMNKGKATTASRLASWFGFVKGKPGNFARIGLSFGRLGWKIAGGIVIFLQADERLRPYTYYFEQQLMGSGATLDGLMKRNRVQLAHLSQNNWNKDICQEHAETHKRTGFKSYYTENPTACNLMKNMEDIKENSRLWRESIHYKFMTAYSNWLMYVENFHSQWNMAYTFFDQFVEYADAARLAEYDPAKSERYNPLLHDDDFTGVVSSERIASMDVLADAGLKTLEGDLTFAGMNVARAQRVIDLLPIIGAQLRQMKSKDFKHKDWKAIEEDLLKISTNITAYVTLNARSKGGKLDRIGAVKEHFSKATLSAKDLATYKDYSPLLSTIYIINKNFDNYASAYKHSKSAVPSRDRTPQETQRLMSLYDAANLYKGLRQFLGNPRPSARGEAFVRTFDDTLEANYTEDQIKKASGLTGSVGKQLMWLALCGGSFIGTGNIESSIAQTPVSESSWGRNVNFIVPRLVEKRDLNRCKGFDDIIPTRLTTKTQNSKMDFLMRNLSTSLIDDTGSNFPVVWETSVLPRISKIYDKFDTSYQILIRDQFKEKFIGKNMENIFGHTPQDAYKYIKNQPRNMLGQIATSSAQGYVDEMDTYLKMLSDAFDASLKQDIAIKLASDATEKNKNFYLEASKKRKERFNVLIRHYRNAFVKILLSFGKNDVNVERDYAGLLVTFLQLNKSMGIVGDLKIEQKNVEENGEIQTKVVTSASRNQFGELVIYQYLNDYKKEEIAAFVKSQERLAGISNEQTKNAFTELYLTNMIDASYIQKLRLRLETQPEIRNNFEEINNILSAQNGAYGQDRNMSLPNIDAQMNISKVPGAIMYTLSPSMLTNQFMGVLGASKSLDTLMEELYFNVSILKAASIDNKYRNIEQEKLQKFKPSSMGMGGRGM